MHSTTLSEAIIEFANLPHADRTQIVTDALLTVRELPEKGPEKWQLFGIITEQFDALNKAIDDLQHTPKRRGRKPRTP